MKFKDSNISAASKRREFRIFMICFTVAFLMNIYGILVYKSPAIEILSQLHIVLLVSLVLYGFVLILRILYHLVARLWKRRT